MDEEKTMPEPTDAVKRLAAFREAVERLEPFRRGDVLMQVSTPQRRDTVPGSFIGGERVGMVTGIDFSIRADFTAVGIARHEAALRRLEALPQIWGAKVAEGLRKAFAAHEALFVLLGREPALYRGTPRASKGWRLHERRRRAEERRKRGPARASWT